MSEYFLKKMIIFYCQMLEGDYNIYDRHLFKEQFKTIYNVFIMIYFRNILFLLIIIFYLALLLLFGKNELYI